MLFLLLSTYMKPLFRISRRDTFSICRKFQDPAVLLYFLFLILNCQIAYRRAEKPGKIP